nr:hypothetical protein [Labrys okinawensis]
MARIALDEPAGKPGGLEGFMGPVDGRRRNIDTLHPVAALGQEQCRHGGIAAAEFQGRAGRRRQEAGPMEVVQHANELLPVAGVTVSGPARQAGGPQFPISLLVVLHGYPKLDRPLLLRQTSR